MSSRNCNYCGTLLIRFQKDDSTGKWKRWDANNNEHTYAACKAIQNNKTATGGGGQQYQPMQQQQPVFAQQQQQQQGQGGTKPEDTPKGITPYSSYILASDTRKEVRELKKQIETLTEIIDSMAQKIELIVKQTGYPKPEPIPINTAERDLEKNVKELNEAFANAKVVGQEDDIKANPGFAEFLDNKKEKELEEANNKIMKGMDSIQATHELNEAAKKELELEKEEVSNFKEEEEEILVNPMRLPKMEEEHPDANNWEPISEKFTCHGCEGFKFNGWQKYGTKICLDCKAGIDAQNL